MGCADLIPGVSGGTIALITGIYEELIDSIRSVDSDALKFASRMQLTQLWKHVNGNFLLHVFGGMLLSIVSLSRLIAYLLEHQPIAVWSFFFGLILVSAFYVMPKRTSSMTVVASVLGAAVAFVITSLSPSATSNHFFFIFISGAIAICAMILPGISGSFILILLAKYEYILNALKAFDLAVIFTFGLGCVVGLLSFSKLIHWLLSNFKHLTMASLAGFMLGSLNKIWPWKTGQEGEVVNVTPEAYTQTMGVPNELSFSIIMCLLGAGIVIALERLGKTAE